MPQDKEIFELKDIEVDTLGLVSRGANREDFFMLKSDETEVVDAEKATDENQMQTANQQEMEEKITTNVWQKLVGLFKKAAKEPGILEQETIELVSETVKEEELISEPTVEVVTEKEEVTQATEIIEETVKGDATMPEDVVSKAEFEKAQNELVEIKKQLEAAKEEKEQLQWVSKANEFGYAPVASTELAKHLHAISKLDNAEATWIVDLLKAYDAMLEDSGMFVEKGSTIAPVDAVEKALKSENLREELLNLDRKSATEYLNRMREVSRR